MYVCLHRQLKYGKVLVELEWVYSTCKETIARLSGRQKNIETERCGERGRVRDEDEQGREGGGRAQGMGIER